MSATDGVLELLRESLLKKYVQTGLVVDVKPVRVKNKRSEVVEIQFLGVSVFCSHEDFSTRKLSSFTGFLGTPVPFLVKDIDLDSGIVVVSRVAAMPLVQKRFLKLVKVGDVVKGTVTGILGDRGIVFVEVQGYPCVIPPGQWEKGMYDLKETVAIGSEVECRVTLIEKRPEQDNNTEDDFEYKIRLSRADLIKDENGRKWDEIDRYHSVKDNVLAKIVGKPNQNPSNYLIELASSSLVIYAHLDATLSKQYPYGLPQGLKVQAQIVFLNPEKRHGKARIFRIDPTLQSVIHGNG